MDRLQRAAVLTRLIEQLRHKWSWCGETHVQKATLFLQDLLLVSLGFDFILYKHGPFSFDLRDELTALRADELVLLEPQRGYGPRIATTDRSKYIQDLYPKTLEKYDNRISFVTHKLGGNLERLATAFFLTKAADSPSSLETRAAKLIMLKPHIDRDEAMAAITEADQIIAEAGLIIERPGQ